ncbi:tumor protein p63-regulated gene 1 protein-like isoform X2 [Artemia franciscana]|uniref:HSac2 domain-containing protein n=2 Tax=Artemia franciscana TaxID=6661 RepID=A0AA88IUB7_ARTSF|nr:hypothetical protein QYM36_008137 [Artemia franciscana]
MSLLEIEPLRNIPSPQLEEIPLVDFQSVALVISSNKGMEEKENLANEILEPKTNPKNKPEEDVTRRADSVDSSFGSLGEEIEADSGQFDEDASKFFTSRDSLIDRAVHDIERRLIDLDCDGSLIDAWLLTLVDHWDHEKERIVILCQNTVFLIKYDFIALYIAEYQRVRLGSIDRIIIGKLKYPSRSIAPKVQNVAYKAGGFFKNFIRQLSDGVGTNGGILNFTSSLRPKAEIQVPIKNQQAILESSGQCDRIGVRLYWCSGKQPQIAQLWNPWSKEIPWVTIISHPLLLKRGKKCRTFDVDDFVLSLRRFIHRRNESVLDPLHRCQIDESSILMETYLGLSSLVHNFGELGYFKVRGKFSF